MCYQYSHNFLNLINSFQNFSFDSRCLLSLLSIALWDVFSCCLPDIVDLCLQIRTFCVHLLYHFHSFTYYIQMTFLLKRFLCGVVNQVQFVFVVCNVLHAVQLLLKVLEIGIELFGFLTDRVDVAASQTVNILCTALRIIRYIIELT